MQFVPILLVPFNVLEPVSENLQSGFGFTLALTKVLCLTQEYLQKLLGSWFSEADSCKRFFS